MSIAGVDGRPVKDFDDLLSYIVHETEVGQTITLDVVRDGGEPVKVQAILAPRPAQDQ